jgi:hypothetical protein
LFATDQELQFKAPQISRNLPWDFVVPQYFGQALRQIHITGANHE